MRWDSGPRRIWSYEGRGRLAREPRGKWPAEAWSQPPLEASGEAEPSSSCGVCGEAAQSFYAPFESVPCSDPGRPRWLEVKEGWDYCSLCRLYATEGHLRSERHRYRQEMYEWENAEEGVPPDPPEAWGDPSYFEWRDGWHWWCKLCEQWSDAGHVQGKRHTKRVQWETWDGEDNAWANTKWAGPADSEDDLDTRTPSDASKPTLDPWGPAWEAQSNSTNSLAAASKRSHQRAEGSRSAGIEQEDEDAGAVEWC